MKKIDSIKDIINQYDHFLIDLNGIMWDFNKKYYEENKKNNIFTHSIDTIKLLHENNKKVIFFSNLRSTAKVTKNLLIKSGLKKEWVKNVVTSSQVMIDYIKDNNLGKNYSYISPEENCDLVENFCSINKDLCKSDFIIARGFELLNDNQNIYIENFNKALKTKKPILFLNPDKEKKEKDVFNLRCISCKKTNNVICFGKPYKEIYEYVFKKYNIKDKTRVVGVGDKIATDILGANNFGIDSIFIINGNIREKIHCDSHEKTYQKILDFCNRESFPLPNYILDNLS